MNKDKESALTEIATKVADRLPVDWPGETEESSRRLLEKLRTLDEIGAVFEMQPEVKAPSTTDEMPRSPSAAETQPLQRWGHLIVYDLLRQGGFGQVYRAFDPDLKKYVALKFPRVDSKNRDLEKTFIKEAQKLAKVRHENVLTIHGVARHDGKVGIWADLIEGATLEDRLSEGGILGAQEAAHIGVEICRALAAVHGAGLIHADVKTSNIMREVGGKYILMDFGAATRAPSAEQDENQPVTGTPLFMAPEQFEGHRPAVSTDIYALGVILFRLVTLRYPVDGRSMHEIAGNHRGQRVSRLRDLRPDLPPGFVQVVEKALSPDSKQRYRTAGEMESALLHFLPGDDRRPELIKPSWLERALLIGASIVALALVGLNAYETLVPFDVDASLFRAKAQADERLTTGSRIVTGDQLFLEMKASRKMHVYVLNQDKQGQAFFLFPLPGLDTQNPLSRDSVHRLPGTLNGTPNYWDVTSAGGEELLFIVASRKPVKEIETIRKSVSTGGNGPVVISPKEVLQIRGIGKMSPRPTVSPNPEIGEVIQGLDTRSSRQRGLWVFEFRLPNPSP